MVCPYAARESTLYFTSLADMVIQTLTDFSEKVSAILHIMRINYLNINIHHWLLPGTQVLYNWINWSKIKNIIQCTKYKSLHKVSKNCKQIQTWNLSDNVLIIVPQYSNTFIYNGLNDCFRLTRHNCLNAMSGIPQRDTTTGNALSLGSCFWNSRPEIWAVGHDGSYTSLCLK